MFSTASTTPSLISILVIGLLFSVKPSAAGVGEMKVRFGFNLLPRQATGNLQTFTGALGGVTADPITETSDPTRPFAVDGNTFADFPSALQRSCGNQLNGCQAIVNGGNNTAGLTLADCDTQQTSCLASPEASRNSSPTSITSLSLTVTTTASAQQTLYSQDANFLYICDV